MFSFIHSYSSSSNEDEIAVKNSSQTVESKKNIEIVSFIKSENTSSDSEEDLNSPTLIVQQPSSEIENSGKEELLIIINFQNRNPIVKFLMVKNSLWFPISIFRPLCSEKRYTYQQCKKRHINDTFM